MESIIFSTMTMTYKFSAIEITKKFQAILNNKPCENDDDDA